MIYTYPYDTLNNLISKDVAMYTYMVTRTVGSHLWSSVLKLNNNACSYMCTK